MHKILLTWIIILLIAVSILLTCVYFPVATPLALAMLLVCSAAIVIKEVK